MKKFFLIAAVLSMLCWPINAARSFNGSSDRLFYNSPVLTTAPMTFCAWIKPNSFAAEGRIVAISNNVGTDASGWYLTIPASGVIRARACDSSICDSSDTAAMSTGTWYHACAVHTSTSSRTAYKDGTPSTPATVSLGTTASLDATTIGAINYNSSFIQFFNGTIAEVSIWNVALTADEITSLSKGFNAPMIEPSHLVLYMPLYGQDANEYDIWGGLTFTPTGTSQTDHPRMFLSF